MGWCISELPLIGWGGVCLWWPEETWAWVSHDRPGRYVPDSHTKQGETASKPISPKNNVSLCTRSYNVYSLQSIPENGSPEVLPNITCTQQAPPASVPSQNSSPPVQPGQGPISLSPQQVLLQTYPRSECGLIWIYLEKALIWKGQMCDYVCNLYFTLTSVPSHAFIW